jgi:IclR family acetate operon transcriptional repressor
MERDATSPRSLTRLLGSFGAIAKAPDGLSLAELSVALGSPKSSLLTLLKPLVLQGYLLHGEGRYRLGPAIFRLASDILAMRRFPTLIRPYMEELVARSGETAFLTVIDRDAQLVSYIEGIDSPQLVRYTAPVGSTRPLYCSSAGRLLLAFQEEAWRERYLRTIALKPMTPHTVTDRDVLRRQIEEIRRTGISVSQGEVIRGAAGVAAPVFNADGSVAAALLIGAPADRFEQELPALRRLIHEVAARASSAMGYGGSVPDEPAPPAAVMRARRRRDAGQPV